MIRKLCVVTSLAMAALTPAVPALAQRASGPPAAGLGTGLLALAPILLGLAVLVYLLRYLIAATATAKRSLEHMEKVEGLLELIAKALQR